MLSPSTENESRKEIKCLRLKLHTTIIQFFAISGDVTKVDI